MGDRARVRADRDPELTSSEAAEIAAATDASSVTSVRTKRAAIPRSAASFSPRSSARSAITTRAPSATNRRTVASPSPPAPPETRADFPPSSMLVLKFVGAVTSCCYVVLWPRRVGLLSQTEYPPSTRRVCPVT